MSQFGIEFGSKSVMGGTGGLERLRESQQNLVDEAAEGSESGEAKSFGDFMKDMVKDTNESSLVADKKLQDVAAGRNKDLHGAVLAMEKADVNFRLISQVRNKVIEAYREILRMQV